MDYVFEIVTLLAPVVVGILTVPILQGIKRVVTVVDNLPAWGKQIAAVLIAYGLAQLAAVAQTPLPETLHAFSGEQVEALVSAGIALAIHAGKKASEG